MKVRGVSWESFLGLQYFGKRCCYFRSRWGDTFSWDGCVQGSMAVDNGGTLSASRPWLSCFDLDRKSLSGFWQKLALPHFQCYLCLLLLLTAFLALIHCSVWLLCHSKLGATFFLVIEVVAFLAIKNKIYVIFYTDNLMKCFLSAIAQSCCYTDLILLNSFQNWHVESIKEYDDGSWVLRWWENYRDNTQEECTKMYKNEQWCMKSN